MWRLPTAGVPYPFIEDLTDVMNKHGYIVRRWEADLYANPIPVGVREGYQIFMPGTPDGTLTLHIQQMPKPKPFARKLRRYDVRKVIRDRYDLYD